MTGILDCGRDGKNYPISDKILACSLPKRPPAIQTAILYGFGDVIRMDVRTGLQIGNGAGDLENAVKRSGRKTEFIDGRFQQPPGGIIDFAMGFDVTAAHAGVAMKFGPAKAFSLNLPGGGHSPANCSRRLGLGFGHQVLMGYGGYLYMDVNAVQQRS